MSELQWLLVILAVLYLWECLCWLPRGSVALISWFGRDWRLRQPGPVLGNQRGGFVLASPLPPLGWILCPVQFPASLSPEGVLLYVATNLNPGWRPAQSGRFIPWDEINKSVADGRKIKVNGKLFFKAPHPFTARIWASALWHIAKRPKADRAEAIAEFQRFSLDDRAAEKLWEDFKKRARPLRLLDNGLLIYMFAVIPAVIWFVGLRLTWIELLAALLVQTVAIAVVFFRAHRHEYPTEEEDRLTHAIMLALSPATAPRAHDALSRPQLQAFHPLVPARLLLPPPMFQGFAGRVLRDLRHPARPVFPGDDAVRTAVESYWREALLENVENYLKSNGLDPEKLCAPPKPADLSCVAYCPRCLTQFTTTEARCSDCGEMPVVAFAR